MHKLISDIVYKLNYIEILKLVIDGLTKFLTLVKNKYFVIMFGLVEKNKDSELTLLLLLLLTI